MVWGAWCWLAFALLATVQSWADDRLASQALSERVRTAVEDRGFEAVEGDMRQALKTEGPTPRLIESLAHLYLVGKRPDQVVLLANRIPDEAGPLALRLASALARSGFREQAHQLVESFQSRLDAFSWDLTHYRATLFNQSSRHRRVVELLKDVPESHANQPGRHYLLALAYQELGKPKVALDHIRTALRSELDPDYIFSQGMLLLSLGNPKEADRVFRQGRQRFPRSAQLHFGQARVYSSIGDFYRAESLFTKAVELEPGHGKAFTFLARLFYLVGDWDSFRPTVHKAIELEPNYFLACYYYGQWILMNGGESNQERALEFFERSVQSNRNFTAGYIASGQILGSQRNWKEALECYRLAAQTGHQGHRVYFLMAQAYRALGQPEAAKRSLKKAGLSNP
jgi:tetratricopeptide (TPR) repeat protein